MTDEVIYIANEPCRIVTEKYISGLETELADTIQSNEKQRNINKCWRKAFSDAVDMVNQRDMEIEALTAKLTKQSKITA